MFLPNKFGMLSRKSTRNIYGEFNYAAAVRVPCGMVGNLTSAQKTPVRADSSADRGASEETVVKTKILFPATDTIGQGDRFEIEGLKLRVIGIEQRFSVVGGQLDHFEVDFDVWPA